MVYYSTALHLYSTEIDPRRNLYIEDIGLYLNGLLVKSFTEFKRFTPAESVTVRIPVDDAEPAIGDYLGERYNYAMVEYADETEGAYWFDWYYFVTAIEMVADGTLTVTLQLDALNTFRNWTGALTVRTHVMRQLANRWGDSGKPDASVMLQEEDVPLALVKEEESEIATSPCYLIYDGTEGSPSLKCTSKTGIVASNNVLIDNSLLQYVAQNVTTRWYHLLGAGNRITINYRTSSSSAMQTKSYTPSSLDAYVGISSGTYGSSSTNRKCAANLFIIDGAGATAPAWEAHVVSTLSVAFDYAEIIIRGSSAVPFSGYEVISAARDDTSGELTSIKIGDVGDEIRTESLGSVDRTKSTLVKIVEIPFEPEVADYGQFVVKKDSVELVFDDIEAQLSWSTDIDISWLTSSSKSVITDDAATAKKQDPKLLTSQFSFYKVVYDSYSTSFGLENIDELCEGVTLRWIGSSAISSSSIMMLEPKSEYDSSWRNVKEDYPFMISSDRNNEIPLYSSEWLNYLRTGYNFDKKSNAMSIATSVLSTVGSLVMGIASIASGGATAAATVPAAVGMASAAIGGWTGTASTINSQLAKETQMKNQSFSVSSVNDLSLFRAYGNATVKVEWWRPRIDCLSRLENLFFYRGYAMNRQYRPELHLRTSFDYIECVPSWSGSFIKKTPPQFISLLNDRLAQGVTIIHHYDNAWDIAQEKGNIEA